MGRVKTCQVFFLGLLSAILFGCAAEPEGLAPLPNESTITRSHQTSIGQSFTVFQSGLRSVSVYLPASPTGGGIWRLHLRTSPLSHEDLRQADQPISLSTAPGFVTFLFPPLVQPTPWTGYFEIEALGSSIAGLSAREPTSYSEGSTYVNGTPVDGQLAFLLDFDPWDSTQGKFQYLARWLGYAALVCLLFSLPGFALLGFWPGFSRLPFWEKLALSFAPGLALAPVAFEYANLFGWSLEWLWVPLIICAGILALAIRHRTGLRYPLQTIRTVIFPLKPDLASLTTALLLALVFWTRIQAVRNFSIPLWGDSLAHTEITQLILDHGGLFSSWEPYAPIGTMTYHFGFHAQAALVAWLAGLPSWSAVLAYGQLLNVLAILALIPLAIRLSGSRWGGAAAVLVAGLVSPLPMMYTDWGRYTQLAGQVLLPLTLWVTLAYLDEDRWQSPLLWLGGLLWAGLALTHYRVLLMGMTILPGVILFGRRGSSIRQAVVRISAQGLMGIALFAPWLSAQIPQHAATDLLGRIAPAAEWLQTYNAVGDVTGYMPLAAWLLLPLGLVAGCIWRKRPAGFLAIWVMGWILIANPQRLHLPGQGIINNTTIEIAGYIPIALAAALLAGIPCARPGKWAALFLATILIGIGYWETAPRIADVTAANYSLVTSPDVRASSWIEANTPADAKFIINAFPAYGGQALVGADGGWWLPLLAHRAVDIPPLLYFSEAPSRGNADEEIWRIDAAIRQYGLHAPETREILVHYGYGYLYIGQLQGSVNNPAPPLLHPADLVADPAWELIYHQDRVWIFRLRSSHQLTG